MVIMVPFPMSQLDVGLPVPGAVLCLATELLQISHFRSTSNHKERPRCPGGACSIFSRLLLRILCISRPCSAQARIEAKSKDSRRNKQPFDPNNCRKFQAPAAEAPCRSCEKNFHHDVRFLFLLCPSSGGSAGTAIFRSPSWTQRDPKARDRRRHTGANWGSVYRAVQLDEFLQVDRTTLSRATIHKLYATCTNRPQANWAKDIHKWPK